MIKDDYQIAIDSAGQPYLDAERALIEQGEAAAEFLRGKLKGARGPAKLITQVILEWIAGNEAFQACVDYFERAQQRAASTPIGRPPPESVAEYLFQHLDDSVASLLGVYIVKLGGIWPAWKTLGSILYLGRVEEDVSADSLIRFVRATSNDHYRRMAVQSIVAIGDASVLSKLEAELGSIETVRDALEQAAAQIQEKLDAQS